MRQRVALFLGAFAVLSAVFALCPRALAADELVVLDLGAKATLELRHIPKGVFTQGSPPSETGHDRDEEGPRQVSITHEFWIGKTPVTRGQFARFVADTHYVTEAEKGTSGGAGWDGKQLEQKKEFTWRTPGFTQTDEHPVVLVTFNDANAFAAWASKKSGKRVRLPSEAQWEYAARAGSTRAWYDATTAEAAATLGWFKTNSGNTTHPVAQKSANAFGLFDMSGNVYQWCRDVYAPYGRDAVVDPEGAAPAPGEPERRVLRGGSWYREPKKARSAARYRNTPGSRNADNGFRVIVTTDEGLAPGLGSGADFAPATPLGLGSATPEEGMRNAPLSPVDPNSEPKSSSGESLGWLLFAAPAGAVALALAWMFGRRRGASLVGPAGVTTRIADDGFWVRASNAGPGASARYDCIIRGVSVSGDVPLNGSEETFVYTGGHPSAVRILEIVAAPFTGFRDASRPMTMSRPPPPLPLRPVVLPSDDLVDSDPPAPAIVPVFGNPRAY